MTTDTLTILRHGASSLAKTWNKDGTITGYGEAKYFSYRTADVGSLSELSNLLQTLQDEPNAMLIRGRYLGDKEARKNDGADFKPGKVRRALDYFEDQPLHAVLIDIDKFEPLGADPLREPQDAICEYILTMLPEAFAQAADPANTLFIDLKDGRVTIRLRPDLAPKHVEQIKALVARKFYDGIVFHRVIAGFMAQTGDPKGNGTGGSDLPNIPAEFSQTPFKRGTLGMARSQSPNSANSQFFICFGDAAFLNGQYTVFGEVTSGMDLVDKIKKGDPAANGTVQNPDRMLKVRLASDPA